MRETRAVGARDYSQLARGMLALMAAAVMASGLGLALAPSEGCVRWAGLRGLPESAIVCPSYNAAAPVLELYNFSLGKQLAFAGGLFLVIAIVRPSRRAIDVGLAYFALAMLIDSIPVLTWLDSIVVESPPPVSRAGFLFAAWSAAGIYANAHRARLKRAGTA